MKQSNIRANSTGTPVGNKTFVLKSQEEIDHVLNLAMIYVETNQGMTSSGSPALTTGIKAANNLINILESATEGRVDLHENEVIFMQGMVG